MKAFYALLLITLIASCKKNVDKKQTNTSASCFSMKILPTNIQEGLLSVFFLNGKDGYASGHLGGIYKTTDSARTWTALPSPVNLPVRGLFFTDDLHGFAVGGQNSCGDGTGCIPPGGFILKTINGGQSWSIIYTPSEKIEISSVYFINEQVGFCAGDNIIFKTIDGGITWNKYIVNNLGGKMMQVYFITPQKGYVVCLFDKILKTEDGGTSWQITSPMRNIGYYSISGSTAATYVSGQGKIIKSTNQGASWSELPNSPDDIFAMYFMDDRKGFAFGRGNYSGGDFGHSYGAIYCTDDGGINWRGSADEKEISTVLSASFPNHQTGYAISGNKVIRFSIQ